MSQNCGHQRAYCSSPGDMWAWRAMVVMMPAGDNSWLVYQSCLIVIPAEISRASRRNGRRSENFACQYLKYLKVSLTCRKILQHGTFGFTTHRKEGVLRIVIAFTNLSLRPGLNPRPLDPVARGDILLWNVSRPRYAYKAQEPRKLQSSMRRLRISLYCFSFTGVQSWNEWS
jgi:hypothetical protein